MELAGAIPGVSAGSVNDILLLEAGRRPLARLSCTVGCLPDIEDAVQRLGLASRRWRHRIEPVQTVAANAGYVIAARPVTETEKSDSGHRTFLFVARDEALADLAEGFAANDVMLGALFGYPSCCVQAFVINRSHYMVHLQPAFAIEGGLTLPFWSNTMVDAFGWHLVSHFPCSAQCQPTRDMALSNWAALAEVDPAHATATLVHMRSVVLLNSDLGLAYGSKLPLGDGRYCVHVLGASTEWLQAFGDQSRIEVRPDGTIYNNNSPLPSTTSIFDFTGNADGAG